MVDASDCSEMDAVGDRKGMSRSMLDASERIAGEGGVGI